MNSERPSITDGPTAERAVAGAAQNSKEDEL